MGKKLNLFEKACIQGMYQNNISVLNMSRHLQRSENVIRKYLAEYQRTMEAVNKIKEEENEPAASIKQPVSTTNTSKIIHETGGKKTRGVAIMTKAGSEKSDDLPKISNKVKTTDQQGRSIVHHIHKRP